jgi:hypothetical protein
MFHTALDCGEQQQMLLAADAVQQRPKLSKLLYATFLQSGGRCGAAFWHLLAFMCCPQHKTP